MDHRGLTGKVALITGAGSGIGRETALLLASQGASIAVIDLDAVGAESVATEIEAAGSTAVAIPVDISDPDAIARCVTTVLERLGRIDILVNNAGVPSNLSFLESTLELWERIQAVNLRAPFLFIQAVARHMIERGGGGKIVNLSSSAAFRGERSNACYAASKAGVCALTRTAAAEFGRYDINVNTVAPGLTRTAMSAGHDPDTLRALVQSGPLANYLGRLSEPEDVANVIAFLCSDASRQITGQTLHTSAGVIV